MAGPSGRREESVQFSLKELLKLEDERLEEQQRATAEHEAAIAQQRDREEKERQRVEAERRATERKIELEELARREAMQKAIVEQGRLEVDVRARADERERERLHELALERIRAESKRGPAMGSLVLSAAMGGGIMLGVLAGVFFGVTKPASERRIAELESSVGAADARSDDLARQLRERERALGERDRQLAETRAELEAWKVKRPTVTGTAPSGPKLVPQPPPPPRSAPQPDCLPGDPMCYSLNRIGRSPAPLDGVQ